MTTNQYAKSFISSNVGAGLVAVTAGSIVLYFVYKAWAPSIGQKLKDKVQTVSDAPGFLNTVKAIVGAGEYADTPPPISDTPYRMEGTTGTGRSMIPAGATPGIVPVYLPVYSNPTDAVIGDIGELQGRAL
jgi:hypothetical protein